MQQKTNDTRDVLTKLIAETWRDILTQIEMQMGEDMFQMCYSDFEDVTIEFTNNDEATLVVRTANSIPLALSKKPIYIDWIAPVVFGWQPLLKDITFTYQFLPKDPPPIRLKNHLDKSMDEIDIPSPPPNFEEMDY